MSTAYRRGDLALAASAGHSWSVRIEFGPTTTLLDVLSDARRDLAQLPLTFPSTRVREAAERRDALLGQLDDSLMPRLRELSAPAIVVVAGSTGAGKSTLVNSLVGAEVSTAGVLRPTTRKPVLVVNPEDQPLLAEHPLGEVATVRVQANAPRGLALLDAPDIDSISDENRDLATRMLRAGDLWLFITTAARYGDAIPWGLLDRARGREVPVAIVLNRVPEQALAQVRRDLLNRLRDHELSDAPLFTVADVGPHDGLLEAKLVEDLAKWLDMLAGPDHARGVVLRSVGATMENVRSEMTSSARAVDDEIETVERLRSVTLAARESIAREVSAGMRLGPAQAAGLVNRWSQATAPGGPLHAMVSAKGRVHRSRRRRQARAEAIGSLRTEAVRVATERLLVAAGAAREQARMVWQSNEVPDGSAGLLTDARLGEPDPTEPAQLARTWLEQIDRRIALRAGHVMVGRLIKLLGEPGLAAVVAAGACGCKEVQDWLAEVMPAEGPRLVEEAQRDLRQRAREVAEHHVDPFLAVASDATPPHDASASLQLRLAELKDLLR